MLAEVGHLAEVGIQAGALAGAAEGLFVQVRRAGGDDHAGQALLLDVVLDHLLAERRAHELVVFGRPRLSLTFCRPSGRPLPRRSFRRCCCRSGTRKCRPAPAPRYRLGREWAVPRSRMARCPSGSWQLAGSGLMADLLRTRHARHRQALRLRRSRGGTRPAASSASSASAAATPICSSACWALHDLLADAQRGRLVSRRPGPSSG